MPKFVRYAVYYLPDDAGLARFGAAWLGWDAALGAPVAQPLGLEAITRAPRRYGFHATFKAPFRLAEGRDPTDLVRAAALLAERLDPVTVAALVPGRLDGFLALVPEGDTGALDRLAFAVVRGLDGFRAMPTRDELDRRRQAGLSARQDALLLDWGYPYVAEEFRFHMTLTDRLEDAALDAALARAAGALPPLARPFPVASIALMGEREDGQFRLIRRFPLGE